MATQEQMRPQAREVNPDALNALTVRLTPLAWVLKTRGEPMAMRGPAEEQLRQVIRDAGFKPVQRDALYRTMFLN